MLGVTGVIAGVEAISLAHDYNTPGNAEYHRSSGEAEGAEWSGRDQGNRLVFTSGGRLFVRSGGRDRELADFNGETPEPEPPPEWATRPLQEMPAGRGARRPR